MKTVIGIAFLEEVKKHNQYELRALVDTVFNALCKKHHNSVSFGRSGCLEFVAAILLSKFDDSTLPNIKHGVDQVSRGIWAVHDFSNFMDKVILENSIISYPAWSKAYRFIEKHHSWLKEHPCSGASTNSTSFTKDIFR